MFSILQIHCILANTNTIENIFVGEKTRKPADDSWFNNTRIILHKLILNAVISTEHNGLCEEITSEY